MIHKISSIGKSSLTNRAIVTSQSNFDICLNFLKHNGYPFLLQIYIALTVIVLININTITVNN
jgi:hypothetical protein